MYRKDMAPPSIIFNQFKRTTMAAPATAAAAAAATATKNDQTDSTETS